ncbi:hypothetical protein HD806DRAFT_203018 [Xylariaceae sp. AK1471]|nr:hypothetical protein HD806DRAFT_203018 [Xylariaceae sp. AK1471]
MPQDPNLYGQRPAKKQKREIPLSSSLEFASQLSSLISDAPSTPSSSSARGGSSKTKGDIFSSVKTKRKPDSDRGVDRSTNTGSSSQGKIKLKHVHGTEEEKQDFARARRKMEEKARLYAAMKRGDYVAKENEAAPLVDFDRKWAERHPEDPDNNPNHYSSSGSDNESSDDGAEMIEYKDEFGRTRTGTRAEVQRLQRRAARSALGKSELEAMAAVPTTQPQNLIFGDAIQTEAFNPEASTLDAMAALAAKRDKEPTPPPDAHFDGRAEIRTKGTGFYQFSRDEDERVKEMENLKAERESTERVRRERELEKDKRRREIEERRRKIGARRAERLAENFLGGLAGEMGIAAAGQPGKGDKADEGKEREETKRVSADANGNDGKDPS